MFNIKLVNTQISFETENMFYSVWKDWAVVIENTTHELSW